MDRYLLPPLQPAAAIQQRPGDHHVHLIGHPGQAADRQGEGKKLHLMVAMGEGGGLGDPAMEDHPIDIRPGLLHPVSHS